MGSTWYLSNGTVTHRILTLSLVLIVYILEIHRLLCLPLLFQFARVLPAPQLCLNGRHDTLP